MTTIGAMPLPLRYQDRAAYAARAAASSNGRFTTKEMIRRNDESDLNQLASLESTAAFAKGEGVIVGLSMGSATVNLTMHDKPHPEFYDQRLPYGPDGHSQETRSTSISSSKIRRRSPGATCATSPIMRNTCNGARPTRWRTIRSTNSTASRGRTASPMMSTNMSAGSISARRWIRPPPPRRVFPPSRPRSKVSLPTIPPCSSRQRIILPPCSGAAPPPAPPRPRRKPCRRQQPAVPMTQLRLRPANSRIPRWTCCAARWLPRRTGPAARASPRGLKTSWLPAARVTTMRQGPQPPPPGPRSAEALEPVRPTVSQAGVAGPHPWPAITHG